MELSKIEELHQLLIEYNFQADITNINSDLICVLCNNLLIDARQGSCGCRYCKKCIEEYLKDGDRFCPHGLEDCIEEALQIDKNISIDYVTNRKVLKLQIICPIECCGFKNELRNIDQHLLICGKQLKICPFTNIGCIYPKCQKEDLNKHLQIDNYKHTELLMESINHFRNDNKITQQQHQMEIDNLKSLNDELTNKNQIILLESQRDKLFVNKLRDSVYNNQISYYPLLISAFVLAMVIYRNMIFIDQLRNQINDKYSQLTTKYDVINKYCRKEHHGEFIWKIEQFSKLQNNSKNENIVCSKPFYSRPNGYKMKIVFVNDYIDNLYISFYVQQINGEFDHLLPRKSNYYSTIAILNQESWQFNTSETLKMSENFPVKKSDIVEPLLINDSIIIQCLVNYY